AHAALTAAAPRDISGASAASAACCVCSPPLELRSSSSTTSRAYPSNLRVKSMTRAFFATTPFPRCCASQLHRISDQPPRGAAFSLHRSFSTRLPMSDSLRAMRNALAARQGHPAARDAARSPELPASTRGRPARLSLALLVLL